MRLPFYFPCCIARQVDLIYLRFKRKRRTSYILGGCVFSLIIYICINVRSILLNTGIICSADMVNEDIQAMSYWKSLHQDTHFPSREEFLNMLYSIASLSTAVPENNKGLQVLIDTANKLYQQEKQTLAAHRNFWLLVEDQEFLMTLLLQDTGLFPILYDTCGELYAVEFVQTLPENLFVPSPMKRDEKLLKAIDLVRYVEKLESIWTVPLHLCDVKMPHFGWNDKSEAKFVDLDSVMTENLLLDTIRNVPHCDTDEDCSFFDCSARCDVQAGKCIPTRTNTNLQVVCGKVLLGRGSSAVPVLGLLADETEDSPLGEALELCRTNPGMTALTLLHVLQKAYSRQSA